MDTRRRESQIQHRKAKPMLEIKTPVLWGPEEMGVRLHERVTAELSLER